jgi:hypothetical protein
MKLVITIVICLLIGFSISHNKSQNRQIETKTANVSSSTSTSVRSTSENANIEKTLRIVAEKWKKTDVNGDGKNNCIDAAVLFYQYYPDKSKVCIEINVNPKTGLNHLFNCVFTDGVWKGIEPQTYATNHSNYLMWAVWGNQYDNSYNRDATSEFIRYVRK